MFIICCGNLVDTCQTVDAVLTPACRMLNKVVGQTRK